MDALIKCTLRDGPLRLKKLRRRCLEQVTVHCLRKFLVEGYLLLLRHCCYVSHGLQDGDASSSTGSTKQHAHGARTC